VDAQPQDDGMQWVYTIRKGVLWHDGTELTAEDVAFTINYNIQNFWLLWAYEPYLNQIKQCSGSDRQCGAQVTGPDEVTIYFQRPFAPGKNIVLPNIQKAQWERVQANEAQYKFDNPTPIGTGPFKAHPDIYTQWKNRQTQDIVLLRNPDYHFGAPSIEQIAFRWFRSESSMVAAFLAGEIDVALLSSAGWEAVREQKGSLPIELQEGPTVIQYWIDIGISQYSTQSVNNQRNPARFDINVRHAMAYATNKAEILQNFYQDKGLVGSTLVSPITPFWHYEPTTDKFAFDLAHARQILDEAGYTQDADGDGIREAAKDILVNNVCTVCAVTDVSIPKNTELSFTMVTRKEAPEENAIAEYLKQTWRQIGIEISYTIVDEFTMNYDVYGGAYDTYIWWWSGDTDPNYILGIQSGFTLDGWNDNYYDNATYNELYVAHLSALDINERRQYALDAQKVHYYSAPFIILVYPYFEYAWWTDEFVSWGDMNAHPGRQIGAFYGKHPLFLELRPAAAPSVSIQEASGFEGQPITIEGAITDSQAGTWYLEFGDGSAMRGSYPDGGIEVSESHTYAAPSDYIAKLSADNGVANITSTATITVQAVGNVAPAILTFDRTPVDALVAQQVNFTVTAQDLEGATLRFTIDFGDNSPPETQDVVAAAEQTITATFSHVYSAEGTYTASITVSDGEDVSPDRTVQVFVTAPAGGPAGAGGLPGWLAPAIGILVIALVALALVAVYRRKKKKEGALPPPR